MTIIDFSNEKNEKLVNELANKYPIIQKALDFAKEVHKDEYRKSGLPYIIHPIAVCVNLWDRYQDIKLCAGALLHDTIEDSDIYKIEDIYEIFDEEIGFIVDAMNKRINNFHKATNRSFEDKTERLLWAGIKDCRILLLKLADRQHNIETLDSLPDNKQVRMAFETQAIFEPLSKILGYDKKISLQEVENNLKKFVVAKDFFDLSEQSLKSFKKYLYDISFNNFDDQLFNLVYKNSSSVVWRIEGMEMFRKLCTLDCFKDKIDLISVKSDGNWLFADFKFLKGAIDTVDALQMSISTFESK